MAGGQSRTHTVTLEGDPGPFQATLGKTRVEDGLALITLSLKADRPAPPPRLTLRWSHPIVDVAGCWHPTADRDRGLPVDWMQGFVARATSSAPVFSLYDGSGRNQITFAFSDALNAVRFHPGVHEEDATFTFQVTIFADTAAPISEYEATLRIDTRDVPYHESIRQVADWWAGQPGYRPADVPEVARLPMYSTWYSFHQQTIPDQIEEQCRLAKQMGCEAVIVDDGWQTTSNARGYAYCGDWEAASEKMSNMREHVRRVHDLGMKYLLWYSVPFVGSFSRAWQRFEDKFLFKRPERGRPGEVAVVDPRFPEVREYLIDVYERAMREWDLDGFKLDFVDSFTPREDRMPPGPRSELPMGGGRDYDSVPEAVHRLLTDVRERLTKIKPDVAIEFRQSYVGPLMRTYGNMFRAGDCPNDAVTNRVRTIDVRLLCGRSAAHADMLMWSPEETPESAALQLLNVLFSVPQISVRIDRMPRAHRDMLTFWLRFWRENRDVLLDGHLDPKSPELLYPVVVASTDDKRVVAVYSDSVVEIGNAVPATLFVVNATQLDRVVLQFASDAGEREVVVRDCRGRVIRRDRVRLGAGLQSAAVPPSGLVEARLVK